MNSNDPLIKEMLVNHTKKVIETLFPKVADTFVIEVFEFNKVCSEYSEIVAGLDFDHVIVLKSNGHFIFTDDVIDKLSKFIEKKIGRIEKNGYNSFYWFEGLISFEKEAKNFPERIIGQDIERLTSNTVLPQWLDCFIFNSLNATYSPDASKYEFNLEKNEEELLVYVGTYFPRSYAESFCIMDDLLSNSIVTEHLKNLEAISVLDIGCGTGGNLVGLLVAFSKYLPSGFRVNVCAIDGNDNALEILDKIFSRLKCDLGLTLELQLRKARLNKIDDLTDELKILPIQSFDFITSYKTICEFISCTDTTNTNSYIEFLRLMCPLLSEKGLLLLLDLTYQKGTFEYLPILFNEQVRQFINQSRDYKVLIPLSCGIYGGLCTNRCYHQAIFTVSHSHKSEDISKVVYKLIGRRDFVELLNQGRKKGKFVVNWKKFLNENNDSGCCQKSLRERICLDAYRMS